MSNDMAIIGALMREPGPVDVRGAIRELRLEILTADLPEGIRSQTSVKQGRLSSIISNQLTDARQRMQLAHCLGHHILHRDLLDNRGVHLDLVDDLASSRCGILSDHHDRQADTFAMTFLVPTWRFDRMMEEGADSAAMAADFGFPERFMKRLMALQRIESAPSP